MVFLLYRGFWHPCLNGAMLGLGRGSLRCRVGALERRRVYLIVKIRAVPRQARPHVVFVGGTWGGCAAG